MDDEGDSGHAPKAGHTLQIIRWVVVVILFTSAVWVLAIYVLDLVGFR
jgi:hypothetical protein